MKSMKNKLKSFFRPIKFWLDPFTPKHRHHQRKMLSFYSQFIKKGDLCFDVGAHVGNRTEVFLKLKAKVVCVEPQDECIKILQKRFRNKNVVLVNKGLAAKDGELKLSICERANTISTMSEKWKLAVKSSGRFSSYKWTKSRMVPVTTLDALIKKYGLPVFCKIDVEGFESSVLTGLSQPIPYLSFEFTREFFDDAKPCINHLLSLGYVRFNCSLGESTQMLFRTWVTSKELCQKLDKMMIDDNFLWGDIYARFL